jgi:hypothetical protein
MEKGHSLKPSVVFVHLGTPLPKYLISNILRTKSILGEIKVVLVHDEANSPIDLQEHGVQTFEFDLKELRANFGIVIPNLSHDTKFWSGYWQNTFNRLFAIGAYQASTAGERVLHIESDVVLFPLFPLDAFDKLEVLAWPRVSLDYDVASIIYSPSATAYGEFLFELTKIAESNKETTDMQSMSKFRRNFPDKVVALPTLPPNESSHKGIHNEEDSAGWELFGGVFDGLTLGHWFTGKDARNSWGIRTRYLVPHNSRLDYSRYSFSLDSKDNITIDDRYPIFNLHVHSKNSGYFQPDNRAFLLKELAIVNSRSNTRSFSLSAFYVFLRTHSLEYLRAIFSAQKWSELFKRL